MASELSSQFLDLVFESSDETEDGFESLVVESADGGMAENRRPLCTNDIG